MESSLLELVGIGKRFGFRQVLHEINLTLNDGEFVLLLGNNGAGKSTAMKALLGMLSLTSGSVEYSYKEISSMLPQNRINLGLAFVPQTSKHQTYQAPLQK